MGASAATADASPASAPLASSEAAALARARRERCASAARAPAEAERRESLCSRRCGDCCRAAGAGGAPLLPAGAASAPLPAPVAAAVLLPPAALSALSAPYANTGSIAQVHFTSIPLPRRLPQQALRFGGREQREGKRNWAKHSLIQEKQRRHTTALSRLCLLWRRETSQTSRRERGPALWRALRAGFRRAVGLATHAHAWQQRKVARGHLVAHPLTMRPR